MAAKSKPTLGQLALTAAPSIPSASPALALPKKLVEYKYGAETWRCERFDELVGEFETVTEETLPLFHQAAELNGRRWLFVRHLFGLKPMLLPAGSDPEDYRDWSRAEICEKFQLSKPQLKAELDAVRGTWNGIVQPSAPAEAATPPKPPPAEPTYELHLADDPLLKTYKFEVRFYSQEERDWFLEKVQEFEVALKERLVKDIAHHACLLALRLRRVGLRLDTYSRGDVGKREWKADYDLSKSIADDLSRAVSKISELCPAASNLAGKMTIQPVVSTITQAFLEVWANNDRRLVDGFFTATEIQIQCRMSEQAPEPQYRAGWVMAMHSAKAGTFDPQWTCPFPEKMIGAMDAAWQAAYAAGAKAAGLHIPDLAGEGPQSEYEDLHVPQGQRLRPSPTPPST